MGLLIPLYIIEIINKIEENGYEAYIVGGSVRDMLMGKVPKDWDVTTNAGPDIIKRLFDKTVDTGIKHGTVTIIHEKQYVEVTTYRKDGYYSDYRRPDSVEFITDLKEDLSRRDFTINAIAYNPVDGFKDFNGGIKDIEDKIIRCVGDPEARFNEDAIRMLRAVRFSAQLDFDIDISTHEAIKKNANLISKIAVERIKGEFDKILVSKYVKKGIEQMSQTSLLRLILPELENCKGLSQDNPHHDYDVYNHTLKAVTNTKPDLIMRLTMLLHDIGKVQTKTVDKMGIGHFYGHEVAGAEMADNILKRLKYDSKTKKTIVDLIRWHDYRINPDENSVRKALNKMGLDSFEVYLLIREADIKAQSSQYLSQKLINLRTTEKLYKRIIKNKEPLTIKDLKINGHDLINLGIKNGKDIKLVLEFLMDNVLQNPKLNEKQTLVNLLVSMDKINLSR